MSLYTVLGVDRDASDEEITKAHRRKAKQHHPDKGGDPQKFAELSQAVAVLRDPARRARYDKTGETDGGAPDNALAQASQMLVAGFQKGVAKAAATGRPIETCDLVAHTRSVLEADLREMNAAKSELAKQRREIEKMTKRLKHKGEGPDILGGFFRENLRDLEKKAEQIDSATVAAQRAKEMADSYVCEVEQQPTAGAEGYIMMGDLMRQMGRGI